MLQEVTCACECDKGSDILTEQEEWHITGLRRSIIISEEETWTLSCLKGSKHHLDTVKLLLSYRQIILPQLLSQAKQLCRPSAASLAGAEPGDSSPNKALGASAPNPNPWDTAEKGVRQCQVQSNTTTCKWYPGCSWGPRTNPHKTPQLSHVMDPYTERKWHTFPRDSNKHSD